MTEALFAHVSPGEQLARALAVYDRALLAPYYARTFGARPRPATEETWRKLPILTRQDLYDNAYPRSRDLLTEPIAGGIIASTGGTSGTARYTFSTWPEWDTFVEMQSRTLRLMGVGPQDRVANLFIAGHFWPSFVAVHEIIKRVGAVHLPISANIPEEEIVRLCLDSDPTVLLSLPTLFVFLADLALRDGVKLPSLRLIAYAGEAMSEAVRQHIVRAFGPVETRALAYTSGDAGLMGYQCASCASSVYHLPTDFQYLEILRLPDGEPVPAGEKGELIVTNLASFSMPIVRYLIGDVASWLREPCPCGDPNPLFQLHGRAGDDFKLGGAFVSMRVVEDAVADGGGPLSMNFNLELEDVGNQMDFVLRVEAGEPEKATEAIARVREGTRRRIHQIDDFGSYLRRFEVSAVPLGTLPRNPWTGKVVKLTDKRP